jgi:ActR/RegA family two-component response regulator
MKRAAKFVLLLDHDSPDARRTAMELAGEEGYVLIARSPSAAVEFAKQYRPTHAIVAESYSHIDGKFLPELIIEFSPETEVILISERGFTRAMGRSV